MAHIRIKGISPYDGEYELGETRAFNGREWRWIKKVSGYMPLTLNDGFAGADPDLFIALACIAMCRNGRITRDEGLDIAEQLSEAPFVHGETIAIIGDGVEAEDDAGPPVLTSVAAE